MAMMSSSKDSIRRISSPEVSFNKSRNTEYSCFSLRNNWHFACVRLIEMAHTEVLVTHSHSPRYHSWESFHSSLRLGCCKTHDMPDQSGVCDELTGLVWSLHIVSQEVETEIETEHMVVFWDLIWEHCSTGISPQFSQSPPLSEKQTHGCSHVRVSHCTYISARTKAEKRREWRREEWGMHTRHLAFNTFFLILFYVWCDANCEITKEISKTQSQSHQIQSHSVIVMHCVTYNRWCPVKRGLTACTHLASNDNTGQTECWRSH